MTFADKGEDREINRNRFRAVVTCLAATLLNPDPSLRERAQDVLTELMRTQGTWLVEPPSGHSLALTAEQYILMRIVVWNTLPWPQKNGNLMFLYRDLWPQDLNGLSEANPELDLAARVRAMAQRCKNGRTVLEDLFAVVSEEGRVASFVGWTKNFPNNMSPAERAYYQSDPLRSGRALLNQSIQRAVEASHHMSKRQSREINLLQTLIRSNRVNNDNLTLDQLQKIIQVHGKDRVLRFAAATGEWKPKNTTVFLTALAKTESAEVHQRQLEALALQVEGVSTELIAVEYPWNDIRLATQIQVSDTPGIKRLSALQEAAKEWRPANVLAFLLKMAPLDPQEIPDKASIRNLSRHAKDVQGVLAEFEYPWDSLSLDQQIALATAEPHLRLMLATRYAGHWKPAANVVTELQKLDQPDGPAPGAPTERTTALKAGSRVTWVEGLAGATINSIQVRGGEMADILISIRYPPRPGKTIGGALIKPGSIQDLAGKVPDEVLRNTALLALREAGFEKIHPALSEKYSFLAQPQRKPRQAGADTEGAPRAASRQKADPEVKKAQALWKRLAGWSESPSQDWRIELDPPFSGERWKGATIGFVYRPLPVEGEEGFEFSPTVTYTADGSGQFGRYDFVPSGIGSFQWPKRAKGLMAELDAALAIKAPIKSREMSSIKYVDPNVAIAAWQVRKMAEDLGNNEVAAQTAFHRINGELRKLFGVSVEEDLADTLRKLKLFKGPEIEAMRRPIRAGRKGQWPVTGAIWRALSNRAWGRRWLSRFEDEEDFTSAMEEKWVPGALTIFVGAALALLSSSPWGANSQLPTMLSYYRIVFVLMHLIGRKDLRPQDLAHWNRIFLIAAAPLIPYAALHGLPMPLTLAGSILISRISRMFHRQMNSIPSSTFIEAAA